MIHRLRLTKRRAGCTPDYAHSASLDSCGKQWHTALHEAAHVVLYELTGRPIFGARIGMKGDTSGITYPHWGTHFHFCDGGVERMRLVMAMMAGRCGEVRGTARDRLWVDISASADDDCADKELRTFGKAAKAIRPRLQMHTRGLVAKHWPVVRRIAATLMRDGTIGVNRPMEPHLRGLRTYGKPRRKRG